MSASPFKLTQSRILYLLVAIAWFLILKTSLVTLCVAASVACMSLPLYRRLVLLSKLQIMKYKKYPACIYNRFTIFLLRQMPTVLFSLAILVAIAIPITVLVVLVMPQIAGGLVRFNELRENKFQLPQDWIDKLDSFKNDFSSVIPGLDSAFNDLSSKFDAVISDFGSLISRGFGVLGNTLNALWLFVLFIVLTIVLVVFAKQVSFVSGKILNLPHSMLTRFIQAIRRAVQAVFLGIVFVAILQGLLCGIGFYFSGLRQPAFWGLLATLVAPIPAVGTALIWLPICISLWFTGSTFAAVGLALWCSIVVAGVDSILRPVFLSQGINTNIFVLLIAMFCGMASFGYLGLIAGPTLLAIAIQAMQEAKSLPN